MRAGIQGSPKLGLREGKLLTVLWNLFCSCRGQKARKTQLSKCFAPSHLVMLSSHVQPCLCNGRESSYQRLIPESQEGRKISEQLAFASRNPKLKKQTELCSRSCAHTAQADLLWWVIQLLSTGLSVASGGSWVLQADLESSSLDVHHVK